eukprot:673308-Prymnesium_polylepis.1
MFTVRSGACVASGNCAQHAAYPASYGNGESCSITVESTTSLLVEHFDVAPMTSSYAWSYGGGWTYDKCDDYLSIDSVQYCGSSGPDGVPMLAGSTIEWLSDQNVVASGWRICGAVPPSPPPTAVFVPLLSSSGADGPCRHDGCNSTCFATVAVSRQYCEQMCAASSECLAYETRMTLWGSARCELWNVRPLYADPVSGYACRVKLQPPPLPPVSPPTSPPSPPVPSNPPVPPHQPPAPHQPPLPVDPDCSNSCTRLASDGDCDDGGPGAEFNMCLMSTDCNDCGTRAP